MISTKITKRILIFIVDFLVLSLSLYLTISLRNLHFVSYANFLTIFYPFLVIIFINLIVFYIYGLYDKLTVKIYSELNGRILTSQIISSLLGAIFFYTSNYFSIAPKTILLIYILISTILIYLWRKSVLNILKSRSTNNILLVASGQELEELKKEIKHNKILNIQKVESLDLQQEDSADLYLKIIELVKNEGYNILAINLHHPLIKNSTHPYYNLLLDKIIVVNFADLYEDILQKIPLENIDTTWFFNNLAQEKNTFYRQSKRLLDLLITIPLFLVSLVFYPFVWLVKRITGEENLFYISLRVGKHNRLFKIYKFQTMESVNENNGDLAEQKRITRFGKFLRSTRIDEFPQLINVILGNLSLIGPRPETPQLVEIYTEELPFYSIRHTIQPGLSGYAQIYQEPKMVPKFGPAISATHEKLAYDIYYLKHKSLIMDLSLSIKTIKNLLGRSGK